MAHPPVHITARLRGWAKLGYTVAPTGESWNSCGTIGLGDDTPSEEYKEWELAMSSKVTAPTSTREICEI